MSIIYFYLRGSPDQIFSLPEDKNRAGVHNILLHYNIRQ